MAVILDQRGRVLNRSRLTYAGETSLFEGAFETYPNARTLGVVASQPEEGNFGRAEVSLGTIARQ